MATIYIDNNNVIELQALTKSVTGALDGSATVTVTVKDKAGTSVTGQTWPAAMAVVAGSPTTGTYRATLDADLALTANREYVAHITATGSGGEIGKWEFPLVAAKRTE